MLAPIFDFFDKLIDNFTWRRLIVVGLVFYIAIICFVKYENYTQAFFLAKTQKQVLLLDKLSKLSEVPVIKSDKKLLNIYENIQNELIKSTSLDLSGEDITSLDVFSSIHMDSVKKFLASFTAWCILTFIIFLSHLSSIKSGGTSTFSGATVVGMLTIAIPLSVLAAFIPTFDADWINYFVYPVGSISLVVAIIMYVENRKKRKLMGSAS